MEQQQEPNVVTEKPLVSIIVPVYKVKKYLGRCVASIIEQTYQNVETILVDDGSPDNCGALCDEYAHKYPSIHVIHQENAGQAAARNNAAKKALGEYIVFIDSDDFVEPDYVEYLLGLLQKYGTDMAIGGFTYLYDGKQPMRRTFANESEVVWTATEALIKINYNQGCGATPWAKIFKKELILKHPFPEGQLYEDLATMYKIVGDCVSVAFGSRKVYYWVQRSGSTMRMNFDERQFAGIEAAWNQIQYVEKTYPRALASAKYRYTAKAVELISNCFSTSGDKKVFKKLRDKMNIYAKDVLKDKHSKKTMKVRIIAVKLGYYPARIVFKLHEIAKKIRY